MRGGRIDPMKFPDGTLDADDRVDLAIAESFPASDPPSWNAGIETTDEWRVAEIVAATDLGDCSRNALDHAIALSRATGAGLTVVHARSGAPDYDDLYRTAIREPASSTPRYSDLYADAFDPAPAFPYDEEAFAALARTHRDQLDGVSRVRRLAVAGDPVDAILDTAQRAGAAIIVIGSRARGTVARALLGSTADAVVRRSGVAVLAVPGDSRWEEGGAVVAVLDQPDVARHVLRRAATIAGALRAALVTLRGPDDGRVDQRAEVGSARLIVIAVPRDERRRVNPNVDVLLRNGLCPVLTVPVH